MHIFLFYQKTMNKNKKGSQQAYKSELEFIESHCLRANSLIRTATGIRANHRAMQTQV